MEAISLYLEDYWKDHFLYFVDRPLTLPHSHLETQQPSTALICVFDLSSFKSITYASHCIWSHFNTFARNPQSIITVISAVVTLSWIFFSCWKPANDAVKDVEMVWANLNNDPRSQDALSQPSRNRWVLSNHISCQGGAQNTINRQCATGLLMLRWKLHPWQRSNQKQIISAACVISSQSRIGSCHVWVQTDSIKA